MLRLRLLGASIEERVMMRQLRIVILMLLAITAPTLLLAQNSVVRDYGTPPSQSQQADIALIVKTLSDKPLTKIVFYQGTLEKAGDRIENVHPLRFLEVIFTSEPLKAAVCNIRSKGWVWGKFIGGTKRSLTEEAARGNLTDAQVTDFAKRVGINPNLILAPIRHRQWDEFVEILLKNVPRTSEHNRYDM